MSLSQLTGLGWTREGAKWLMGKMASGGDRSQLIAWRSLSDRPRPYSTHFGKQYVPAALRWEVWERDNFTCRHCGSRQFLTVDHIVPEASAGQTILSNLQTLCKQCNCKKGPR